MGKERKVTTKRRKEIEKSLNSTSADLSVDETLKWIESYKSGFARYSESVDICITMEGIDPRKSDHSIKGSVDLPFGVGKDVKVLAFVDDNYINDAVEAGAHYAGSTDLIESVKSGKCTDFDICVAQPEIMPKLATELGRILGPKGLMPNPKFGTVGSDIVSIVKSTKLGRVKFRSNKAGIVHAMVGNIYFPAQNLKENIISFISSVKKLIPSGGDINSVYLSTSQGPSLKLDINNFIDG